MLVPATLAPYVVSIAAYDVDLGAPGTHRGLPSTTVTLVLPVDEPLEVSWSGREQTRTSGWSTVSGLHDEPAAIHHTGHQRGVQVALTSSGARALLDVPAGELAGQLLSLDEAGRELARLPEELAGAAHDRRADLVARRLAEVLARRGDVRPRAEVARALARLTRGRAVQEIAREVGLSRRHLGTLVRAETGLSPKQWQRVARFEAAHALLGRRPLAEVAATCGYTDQAHLTRDWRDLAGCTPTTWLREEFPFVQDAAPDARPS